MADVEPGSVHDITVARDHVLGALYWTYSHLDLPTLTDGGYEGAQESACTPRSNNRPVTRYSTWTTAPNLTMTAGGRG